MKQISADRRLEMIRRIREESGHNQSVVAGREGILYETHEPRPVSNRAKFWKLRMLFSIFLFTACLVCQYSDDVKGKEQYQRLCTALQEEISLNSIDFIGDFPYTLNDMDFMETGSYTTKTEEGL